MAKFSFTLPNGLLFTLEAPAGTTAAAAERVYLEQLAAGAFVGLTAGDTLQSPTTTGVQFALSRLDRGTAGVPDIPLLAIYNDGVVSSLPALTDVPINNGITVSDYVDTSVVTESIGLLFTSQVQAVMAAVAASVCQPAEVITNELGVGKYGFDAQQLEAAGYLKPGTAARFLLGSNSNNFVDVLSSPGVWTGKTGVTSISNILTNSALQDKIQFGLMQSSYTTLVQTGQIAIPGTNSAAPTGQTFNAVTGELSSITNLLGDISTGGLSGISNKLSSLATSGTADLGGLLANASKFGVSNAVDWAKGKIPTVDTGSVKSQMDSLAKQGQFAVNFSDFKLPAAVAGIIPAAGFTGTIDRSTLNAAFVKLVGSDKIPAPSFSPQAVDPAAMEAAARQARAALNGSAPRGLAILSSNVDSFVNSMGSPNAPPYTGDDPNIRQRLGLPPMQTA